MKWYNICLCVYILLGQGKAAHPFQTENDRTACAETGENVPANGCRKRRSQMILDNLARIGSVPAVQTERIFYGATLTMIQQRYCI